MEQWVVNSRFPNHEVSTHGRVRNRHTGYVLKPFLDRYGYLRVSIGSTDNVYIHKLVCETFYGESLDPRSQVNHIDGDRQNNHVFNLEWCSPSENIRWAMYKKNLNPMVGLEKAREANLKSVRLVESDRVFPSVKECADFLGVKPSNISRCLIGARQGQSIHGYHVEYV